jgi:CheY-like chemotaxis protein
MADKDPWGWLLISDARALRASSLTDIDVTAQLIKQGGEALESSRALLERTRPIRLTDLIARRSTPTFTVLFVDDDELVRDALSRIIDENGFGLLAAKSAAEALAIIERQRVDVLFTDIVMPGRDAAGRRVPRVVRGGSRRKRCHRREAHLRVARQCAQTRDQCRSHYSPSGR